MPIKSELLTTPDASDIQSRLGSAKVKQAMYYDRGTKPKESLNVGDTVRARLHFDKSSGWEPAEVKQTLPFRSYVVRNKDGNDFR